ncbi:N-acetyltransferase [Streptococcus cuniculi]|uniref:N-acetyltransferase n=1 Tax=Streptococcus cuniculi TaxID=1432788 RepID=A0A4Y9J778_9STRE|nr:GNAT family protein [Streptococcus cuniculi]MBF0779157.1 GNAT family N-acetyltransferase [Streptococcus cuniculi]TFU96883.1 N-acetyltransferase [Streptococcus cuniculi]
MPDTFHLKAFTEAENQQIWEISYKEVSPKRKNYSASYQAYENFEALKECDDYHFLRLPRVQRIFIREKPRWLEMGIIIYDAAYWGGSYGTQAFTLWTEYIFTTISELDHIGLTTWSGNQRMMKVAEKLGMTKEAQIRKVR